MKEVVIVDAVRTPIGRYNGALKNVRPDDLAAGAIKALLNRNTSVPLDQIEEVVLGNANQAGEDNRNVARMTSLLAGLPVSVAGTTINRLCGSGMDAVMYCARAIAMGEGDIFIAGGTESMTRAPLVTSKPHQAFPRGNMELIDTTLGWRFINPQLDRQYGTDSMASTAQKVADRYGISREEQDEYAFLSQQRVQAALRKNSFHPEIVPVEYTDRKGNQMIVDQDEHPRPETNLEKLAQLKPLMEGGTVTAGNSSGINDGASVLLLMSREKAIELGLKPLARYAGGAVSGVEPAIMGIGPVYSTRKLLARTGISIPEIGLIELNEAFASQTIACMKQLELDPEKVNVNGGSIALGHPLGASGARLLTTLVHQMHAGSIKYGLATMCVGVGQGVSVLLQQP
ncbi:thiolase family protein [Bacillus testis]|uniref:thiolase family protein n=1 Tax=Bacillus testis TaxID=1622072 RepID=UPI00067F61A6|nr:acetyl-CoA C-acyltransferase [Bacillus testis]